MTLLRLLIASKIVSAVVQAVTFSLNYLRIVQIYFICVGAIVW